MTKKLEELFGFDTVDEAVEAHPIENLTPEQTRIAIVELDATIDKIDNALPAVRDLDTSDQELDEIAELAKTSYQDLSDLGMNVDSRFSAELFSVAATMLNTALTAKTTKLNKKLKIVDLQMKKLKLDQDQAKLAASNAGPAGVDTPIQTAEGTILTRNDLLERLINSREQKDN